MLIATAVALGASWGVARGLGGDSRTVSRVTIALLAGSLLTFAPALLRISKDYWGVAVLASGVARSLIVLGICYSIRETSPDVAARPLFLGAAAGAFILLVIETIAAVKVLSALDRRTSTGRESA